MHPYFPGQFRNLILHFRDHCDAEIFGFGRGLVDGREMPGIPGIMMRYYGTGIQPILSADHPLAETESFIREAASLSFEAEKLRGDGWIPDLIYCHVSWGSTTFLHEVFPSAKFIKYCEWYYNNGIDATEYLTGARPLGERIRTQLHNLPIMAELSKADALISPTRWQRSQFPDLARSSIQVVPDGVDTNIFCPKDDATFMLPSGRVLKSGDKVVTYVARGADPFRGFRPFMEAVALLQASDPEVEVVVVGDRKIYYGPGVGTDGHFVEVVSKADFDANRTHFIGRIPYDDYISLLQISAAHVYLTVPFVMSWSALEALATGCVLVASDTAPVREFVDHGQNGLLVQFDRPTEITDQITGVLNNPSAFSDIRAEARSRILAQWSNEIAVQEHLSLTKGLGVNIQPSKYVKVVRRDAKTVR